MLKFEYFFWDFDGTLFDTYPHIVSIIREILKMEYNIDLNPISIEEWVYIGLEHCFNKIAENFNLDLNHFKNLFSKEYILDLESKQQPFPGAKDMLTYIKQKGGKNFIITHRGFTSLFRLLEYNKIENLIEENITNEDDFPRKPDPASFLFLIGKYEMQKEKLLIIGDRDMDIQAAKSINTKACYFNPSGKINELADYNIRNLIELKEIIDL
ncbi:MAG: HAD-IA family hydrolase [Promethearchaeota archaeon]